LAIIEDCLPLSQVVATMNIGDSIKRIREERGLTQQQVADLIGMHRSNYSKIEKGQRDISVASIVKIAQHFNITLDELLSINSKTNASNIEVDDKLNLIQGLSDEDREVIYRVIDLLIIEKRFKDTTKKKQ
jgi:transcriptional regulator with XRE-family HTH domain